MGTRLHYFDWMNPKPKLQAAFSTVMSMSRMNRGDEWFNFNPVEDKMHVSGSQTLLVDVGGGLGHDLIAFHEKFPQLLGRLLVQNIVINGDEKLPSGVEAMKYDFLAPRPIRDAKVYYLQTVLHEWPDKQAREILGNFRLSMDEDSILLIKVKVLPESSVPLYSAELDLEMMAVFSSLDRTKTQSKTLLERSDFDLVNIWTPKTVVPGSGTSGTLFEAVLKH